MAVRAATRGAHDHPRAIHGSAREETTGCVVVSARSGPSWVRFRVHIPSGEVIRTDTYITHDEGYEALLLSYVNILTTLIDEAS